MLRIPPSKLAKILTVAGHDDAVLGDRAGQHVRVRRAVQADLIHVHGVEAERKAEMPGKLWRQVLVDQEAGCHSSPAGRPRGGLAVANSAAASTVS